MRTHDEVVAYCGRVHDLFGFAQEVLLPYLPVERAQLFTWNDRDLVEWEQKPLTYKTVIADMRGYMDLAWRRVQDHNAFGASSSIDKMRAWIWLLGDEETLAFAKGDIHYSNYGAPILKRICEKYDFPAPCEDAVQRMAQGLPCCNDCRRGCLLS